MAAPVFQAAGTFQSGGAVALTVPWPASHAVDDIGILVVCSAAALGALATPAGFVEIPNSPLAGTALNMNVYWCRATSTSMTSPVTATSANNISAVIVTARGCITTGNPWGVITSGSKATTSTATSIAGATTLVPETLIVYAAARGSDAAANQYSGEADSTLTGVAERVDNGTVTGNGGGIGIWTGTKATKGAYGPLTATLAGTSIELFQSIALKPPTPAGTVDVVVSAGADDGFYHGSFVNNGASLAVGDNGGTKTGSFMRFLNVTIPQGATITSAVLSLTADLLTGAIGNVDTKVRAVAADNAVAPTDTTTYNALVRTTASVNFDPTSWDLGTNYNSPDIATVVQEVISRAGWVSGNALTIMWEDRASATNSVAQPAAFEHTSRQEPRLVITYTSSVVSPVSLAVTANSDDGYGYAANFDSTTADTYAGKISADSIDTYLRFLNVGIPQGAVVYSAVLKVRASASGGTVTDIHAQVRADDSDNATAPTTAASLDGKPRTTAKVDWDPTVWTVGTEYSPPDLAAVVQEVVDRAGWVSGNALQLFVEDDGSSAGTYMGFATLENVTYSEALLVVDLMPRPPRPTVRSFAVTRSRTY